MQDSSNNQNQPSTSAKSAGKLYISEIPTAFPNATVKDMKKMLRTKIHEFATINYIYIVNQAKHLLGVISIKELYQAANTDLAKDIMTTDVKTVRPHTHQERATNLALRYSVKAMPVVDKNRELLGVIPFDTILRVLEQEATEEILRTRGIELGEFETLSLATLTPWQMVYARVPWLLMGLVGGLLSANIIDRFHFVLERELILASFIPLIVYMGDAVGNQTQTLYIRSMSTGKIPNVSDYMKKEMRVGLLIAFIICLIVGASIWFIFDLPFVSVIVALSIFLTVTIAMLIGLFIPLILTWFKKDPAIGAGPFATIVRDTTSIIVYFSISSLFFALFR